MKIENTMIAGFIPALVGMRNPMESHALSDTHYCVEDWANQWPNIKALDCAIIGPRDMKLACKLIKLGSEHRKFLRQIQIWVELTLPRYAWTELDTYKIGTVRNSCSTMHRMGRNEVIADNYNLIPPPAEYIVLKQKYEAAVAHVMVYLDAAQHEYTDTKDYDIVHSMKSISPEGMLQKAQYSMNYETALTMYLQRRGHRLEEWNVKYPGSICRWIRDLPYMLDFVCAVQGIYNG